MFLDLLQKKWMKWMFLLFQCWLPIQQRGNAPLISIWFFVLIIFCLIHTCGHNMNQKLCLFALTIFLKHFDPLFCYLPHFMFIAISSFTSVYPIECRISCQWIHHNMYSFINNWRIIVSNAWTANTKPTKYPII